MCLKEPDFSPQQVYTLPQNPRPIVSIGLGGIVHDAHFPAYKIAGFQVVGGYDVDPVRAKMMQDKFAIPVLYSTVEEAVSQAPADAVFDLAVPGSAIMGILQQLKPGSTVLIQKPMGEDLMHARAIRSLCHEKGFKAAVNFQLRFMPHIVAARRMIDQGLIGEVVDMEVRMQSHTPWGLWPFLATKPRMEILYHSIHYVDLARSFLGDPKGVYAKALGHPMALVKADARTTIMLDYGDNPRATILTNHNHHYSASTQDSYVKFEGTMGAIHIRLGLALDYPRGAPDEFRYILVDGAGGDGGPCGSGAWQTLHVGGSWFPEAFIGTMASLMRYANGETDALPTSVDDAYVTMAVVEAAYQSSQQGGTAIPH
jgi:predicted dehydrogenase|eukprot:CAMPEP_0174380096 /NCGR_PEP_ID=MMETSP0811_2-20130205/123149_1 /TAXON_ID=73025 ORGANISM="Eutreptiella gymnastica-like, Strain CCMP1594" /NCGR_SAMPLE_ID=MMETSP0811_2 /ASSEMBLY_ACC=CAM_ASM_000667 /LENGTH=369 /DNA_ID=CAMNT_0015532859 /DNA_START=38 /DNA_END=1147 /DNA_ORIENTATION=-